MTKPLEAMLVPLGKVSTEEKKSLKNPKIGRIFPIHKENKCNPKS
jgi:hypothetical protein